MNKQRWSPRATVNDPSAVDAVIAYMRNEELALPDSTIAWPAHDEEIMLDRLPALMRALQNIAATSVKISQAQNFPSLQRRVSVLRGRARALKAIKDELATLEWLGTNPRLAEGPELQRDLERVRLQLMFGADAYQRSLDRSRHPGRLRDKRPDLATMLFVRNLMTVWRVLFLRKDTDGREFRKFVMFCANLCGRYPLSDAAIRDRVLQIKSDREAAAVGSRRSVERLLELEKRQIQFAISDNSIVDV